MYILYYFKGKWYIYCTTGWEDRMGTALCKELNYGSMYFSTPKDPDMPVRFIIFIVDEAAR